MAIARVQGTSIGYPDIGPATTYPVAFGSDVTAGNLLVALVVWNSNGSFKSASVTDSLGNTWTPLTAVQNSSGAFSQVQIFYVENCLGGANTVTMTLTESNYGGIHIAEYSGIATSGSFDVEETKIVGGNVTTLTSDAYSTSQDSELAVVIIGEEKVGITNPVWTSPFTGQTEEAGSVSYTADTIYSSTQTGTTCRVDWTNASTNVGMAVACFKAAAAASFNVKPTMFHIF